MVRLISGSSLTGFTVTGGGYSGVYAEGTVRIAENVIAENRGWVGGGIYAFVNAGGEFVLAASSNRCFADVALSCAEIADCQVCESDHATTCESAEDCGGSDCVYLGPCLAVAEAVLDDNVVRDNAAERFGGGIFAFAEAPYETGGARVVATGNTVAGNVASDGYGGGIFVQSRAIRGTTEALVESNVVEDNEAVYAGSELGHGGGIGAMSLAWDFGGRSSVLITENTIEGNAAGYMGGGIRAEGGAFYAYPWSFFYTYGTDTTRVSRNAVTGNAAYDGGGVSAWLGAVAGYSYGSAVAQNLIVGGNTVTGNSADRFGGGVEAFLQNGGWYGSYPETGALRVADNVISGNTAGEGGGGLFGWNYVTWYGNPEDVAFEVSGNEIRENSAGSFAGGAFVFSDADENTSFVDFHHNLLLSNAAHDPEESDAVGGGALLAAGSWYGYAAGSHVSFGHNTVAGNSADLGAGGVEIESMTASEGGGWAEVDVRNSIVADNVGWGIGGPVPGMEGAWTSGGSSDLQVSLLYSDVFGNTQGPVERTLGGVLQTEGLIEQDPLLDDEGVPDVCSPTTDAGDPADDYSAEPDPNGFRVNQGHLGGTEDAVTALPDVTGDRRITGADLIEITTAFGATEGDLRWHAPADLDRDGDIDGDDLAYVASKWGAECP